ncbi:hypothetical protein [Fredinandcohnia quinoae]|uniref:Uncharacterized protein n=1 Tax=Fredinandcohnia quinoae TaxID=2918902 RepID=A0AAW5E018_9BACI|nr:hypothetical protein [Fredinandcohnia sp. SECRCQ15]MCH1626252.1 hypothetical protein [Fredinandcohnia sp. SECRCQ15]
MSRYQTDDSYLNKDTKLQLQQKIIHYHSEIISYQNKIKKMEHEFEKEKIRNKYLQEKLHEVQHTNLESYEKEIAALQAKLLSYEVALEEEKSRIQILEAKLIQPIQNVESIKIVKAEPVLRMQSLFNYSFINTQIEDDEESFISILGDFIIENLGTVPLHSPIICIRIVPINAGHLSGKIAINQSISGSQFEDSLQEEWQFVHENWKEKVKGKGEYWIKPVKQVTLNPSERIIFSNFELNLKRIVEQGSIIAEGFAYCSEIPNGIPALNKIILNM